MMITFNHNVPLGSFNRLQAQQLIKAVLAGDTIQWKAVDDWHSYISNTPGAQAEVITDILGDCSAKYRVLPTAFLVEWENDADHEGVDIETALEWFNKGKATI